MSHGFVHDVNDPGSRHEPETRNRWLFDVIHTSTAFRRNKHETTRQSGRRNYLSSADRQTEKLAAEAGTPYLGGDRTQPAGSDKMRACTRDQVSRGR
jgi:hypothetical protein